MNRYLLTFVFLLFFYYSLNSQLLEQIGNIGQTYGHSIAIDKDSNIYLAGTFQGTLNCNPKGTPFEITSNFGTMDVFFAKYNKLGEIIWAKSIGTAGIDYVTKIDVDNTGNVFVSGYFGEENVDGRFIDLNPNSKEDKKYGPGGIDCFVIKLKPDGEYLWGLVLGNIKSFSTEIIWDMEVTKSGNVFISGIFAGTVDFNPLGSRNRIDCPLENHGYFTGKYDKDGKLIWLKTIGANITNPLNEGFSSLSLDGNENCFIGANFRAEAKFVPDVDMQLPMQSVGDCDMFIAKYTSNGNISFRGGFGGKLKDRIFPQCLKYGTDGNIYVSGNFLGKCDFYPSTGSVEIENQDNSPDIFLSSYNSNGALRWVQNISGDDWEDKPKSIVFDNELNIILSGNFCGTTNFDPSGSMELSSKATNGAADIFVVKYNNSGNLIWARQFGDKLTGMDKNGLFQISSVNGSAVDIDDNILLTGGFFEEVDFGEESNPSKLKAKNVCDLFLVKLDYDGKLWYKGGARPSLRIISPNGGEHWNVDSTRIITWYFKNVNLVKLEYSVNDGESWLTIADSISAESSSFSWIVEDNPSEKCKVKITNLEDSKILDTSNENFIITNEIKASRVIFSIGNPSPVNAIAAATDKSNNIIVSGSFVGTINMDRGLGLNNLISKGTKDMYLAKYNETGDLLWSFNIGGDGLYCEPTCMGIDGSDNIYISGYFGGQSELRNNLDFSKEEKQDTIITFSGFDAFIAKYDKNGNFLWAFPIGNKSANTKEIINDIAVENNGTIYVTGIFNGITDFDGTKNEKILQTKTANPEHFIGKYNSSGVLTWVLGLKTNIIDIEVEGKYSIISDGSGGCFLLGSFRDSTNFNTNANPITIIKSKSDTDIFLAHYRYTSILDWVINIQGESKDLTGNKSLILTPEGFPVIAGTFKGKADFDPTLGKREFTSTNNNDDMFLACYGKAGEFKWMKQFPSNSGFDFTKSIVLDDSLNIIHTGYFQDDLSLSNLDTSIVLNSKGKSGASDIFVFKHNIGGNFIWTKTIGVDTSGVGLLSQPNDISIDSKNNIILTGLFFGKNVDFDSDSTVNELSSQGKEDAFIAKYFSDGSLWIEDVDTARISLIRPNGNEVLQANTTEKIIWQSSGIDTIAIEYSLDAGLSWKWITQLHQSVTGQYTWLVPDTVSETCKIHIFDPKKPKRTDISSRNFKISNKKLVLTRPIGGESFHGDSIEKITWETKNVSQVNIYYSTNNGINWNFIVLFKNADSLNHLWKVKNVSSTNCLIKIVDRFDSTIYDISEKPFTIIQNKDPEIRILFPNGGEELLTERNIEISFISHKVDSVKIELKNFENKMLTSIIDKLTIADDSTKFSWIFEDESFNSDSCKIIITSLNDNMLNDESDDFFTINADLKVNERNNFDCFARFLISPNPAGDRLNIEYILEDQYDIVFEFYNNLGKKISTVIPESISKGVNIIGINLTEFSSGIIILKVNTSHDSKNCINYFKFIKQ